MIILVIIDTESTTYCESSQDVGAQTDAKANTLFDTFIIKIKIREFNELRIRKTKTKSHSCE